MINDYKDYQLSYFTKDAKLRSALRIEHAFHQPFKLLDLGILALNYIQ